MTEEQKAAYETQGYLVVEEAFDPGELDRVRTALGCPISVPVDARETPTNAVSATQENGYCVSPSS